MRLAYGPFGYPHQMNPHGRLVTAMGSILLVTSLGLASCSTSSAVPGATASPSSTGTAASSPTNADGQVVTATQSAISFRVPTGWQVVSRDELTSLSTADPPRWLVDLAAGLGQTPAQIATAMRQADLLVLGSPSGGSFAPNVNVVYPGAGVATLPSPEAMKAGLRRPGLTVLDAKSVKVAGGGRAVVVAYELTWGATTTVKGRSVMYLHSPGHAGVITISTLDDAESDRLLTQVLSSLTAAP